MSVLVVLEARFVTVKGAVTGFTVVVNVHICFTIATRNNNAGLLLFCKIQAGDDLENFNQNINFERKYFQKFMQGIL